MKNIFSIFILAIVFSCSSDDGGTTGGSAFPKTTTMNFEVTTTDDRDASITTTIDDVDLVELSSTSPYIKPYENRVVSLQTVFKLKYEDLSPMPFVAYQATLIIKDVNNIVKTQSFNVTQQGQIFQIEYMFSDDN
jgi:hypothetical protein